MHFHVPRLAPPVPGADGLCSSPFTWPTKSCLCSKDEVSGGLQLLPQLLARVWHSPVPGQPAWQPQEQRQAHPARTCAVLWLPAPAAGCSLLPFPAKSLHPSGRQLAARVWDWQGQGVLILLGSAQITQPGQGWVVLSGHALQRNKLCLPPCREKKSGLRHFFFHPESTADASFSCPSGILRSGNPQGTAVTKTTVGWSKTCPVLQLRAGSAGG